MISMQLNGRLTGVCFKGLFILKVFSLEILSVTSYMKLDTLNLKNLISHLWLVQLCRNELCSLFRNFSLKYLIYLYPGADLFFEGRGVSKSLLEALSFFPTQIIYFLNFQSTFFLIIITFLSSRNVVSNNL